MMHRWKPGDALRAPWLNESVSALRANRVRVDGASARKGRSRGGTQVGRNNAHPIWATVSGSSSPYTFTEAFEDASGVWSAGWRTGTAYEVNGVGSLNGTRHRLIPNRFGGWRFQAVKHGTGHSVCGCSGLPDTLTCSYRYLLSGGTTFNTISFNLTWNAGTISVYPGPYSVTGYWESDCIDVSDGANCGTIYPAMDICSIKFYFYCDPGNPGQFNMASDAYTGAGCTGTRYNGGGGPGDPPLAGIYDTGTRRTATCSPFFWRYPGSGTPTFQVSP